MVHSQRCKDTAIKGNAWLGRSARLGFLHFDGACRELVFLSPLRGLQICVSFRNSGRRPFLKKSHPTRPVPVDSNWETAKSPTAWNGVLRLVLSQVPKSGPEAPKPNTVQNQKVTDLETVLEAHVGWAGYLLPHWENRLYGWLVFGRAIRHGLGRRNVSGLRWSPAKNGLSCRLHFVES
jgi:hypothetical protein